MDPLGVDIVAPHDPIDGPEQAALIVVHVQPAVVILRIVEVFIGPEPEIRPVPIEPHIRLAMIVDVAHLRVECHPVPATLVQGPVTSPGAVKHHQQRMERLGDVFRIHGHSETPGHAPTWMQTRVRPVGIDIRPAHARADLVGENRPQKVRLLAHRTFEAVLSGYYRSLHVSARVQAGHGIEEAAPDPGRVDE